MVNTKFEAYKIRRELKRSGIEFEFKRYKKNAFNEPVKNEEPEIVGKLKGLFHTQTSNIQISTGDTTQTRTKSVPMILCLHEDVSSLSLCVDDIMEFNKTRYKVTGVINIQEWNIISDISLEVVDIVISA